MSLNDLLEKIRCPLTGEPLAIVSTETLNLLLQEQANGTLFNQLGIQVEDEFDQGLVNQSSTCFIMVRREIPFLSPDQVIPIDHLEFSKPA